MPPIAPGTPLHAFVESIGQAVSEVFSQALSSPWSTEIASDDPLPSSDASHLCFLVSASGGLQGTAALLLRNADALLLAQKCLAESIETTSELGSSRKEAVEALFRQVAGAAATGMKSLFGEVQLHLNATPAPAWPGVSVVLAISEASAGKLFVELKLSADLLASVSSFQMNPGVDDAPVKRENQDAEGQGSLNRLLGVNLNLSLRFGQRSLTLREILDLNSGAVVELDRQVQEPADLLLGEKLIARGEVIIVDGNYGIRITEVVGA
jgi:flagellar motor switch protein FliN